MTKNDEYQRQLLRRLVAAKDAREVTWVPELQFRLHEARGTIRDILRDGTLSQERKDRYVSVVAKNVAELFKGRPKEEREKAQLYVFSWAHVYGGSRR